MAEIKCSVSKLSKCVRKVFVLPKLVYHNLRLALSSDVPYVEESKNLFAAKRQLASLLKQKTIQLPLLPENYLSQKHKKALFIRLDYWTKNSVGGSITHTINVIKQLQLLGIQVTAVLPKEYPELTTLGVEQIILSCPDFAYDRAIFAANQKFHQELSNLVKQLQPDFIYERVIPGMYVGAIVATELSCPYIVEYNGSELIMNSSYSKQKNLYQSYFIDAEKIVFQQASCIITVSEIIADYLFKTGILAEKVLINPNGADPAIFKPCEATYLSKRQKLNIAESDILVGFIGTFGGWHGIDIIAKAAEQIATSENNIRFVLIGNGENYSRVSNLVIEKNLEDRILLTGFLDASDSIEYLQACDILLSPQTNSLKKSQFYGSPIKMFEYMGLGKAIIASDLMQIGQVLRPALLSNSLDSNSIITDEAAVLIPPGAFESLRDSILFLAENSEIREKLGANARKSLLENYTWNKHVAKIIAFAMGQSSNTLNFSGLKEESWQSILTYSRIDSAEQVAKIDGITANREPHV